MSDPAMKDPVIVGVDASLQELAICARRTPTISHTALRGAARLDYLSSAVMKHAARGALIVIEGYAFSKSNRSHQIGELGGVIRTDLFRAGVAFVEVPPAILKKYATGRGNASKGDMIAAAVRRLGYEGGNDNEADALWLYAMGMDAYDNRIGKALPADQRAMLSKVAWP